MNKLNGFLLATLVLGLASCKSKPSNSVEDAVDSAQAMTENVVNNDDTKALVEQMKANINNPEQLKSTFALIQTKLLKYAQEGDTNKLKEYAQTIQNEIENNEELKAALSKVRFNDKDSKDLLSSVKDMGKSISDGNFNLQAVKDQMKALGLTPENAEALAKKAYDKIPQEAKDSVKQTLNDAKQTVKENIVKEGKQTLDKAAEQVSDKTKEVADKSKATAEKSKQETKASLKKAESKAKSLLDKL